MTSLLDVFYQATQRTLKPDWEKNLRLVDIINTDPHKACGYIIPYIQQQLRHKDPLIVWLTLIVLETCVKNCGTVFAEHIANKYFLRDLKKLVIKRWVKRKKVIYTSKAKYQNFVGEKAARLVQSWGIAFHNTQFQNPFYTTYMRLLKKGIKFPLETEKSRVPVITPQPSKPGTAEPAIAKGKKKPVKKAKKIPQTSTEDDSPDTEIPKYVSNDITATHEAVKLLDEVLGQLQTESEIKKSEIVKEIITTIQNKQARLQGYVNDYISNEAILDKLLSIHDIVQQALKKYNSRIGINKDDEESSKEEEESKESEGSDDEEQVDDNHIQSGPNQGSVYVQQSLTPNKPPTQITPNVPLSPANPFTNMFTPNSANQTNPFASPTSPNLLTSPNPVTTIATPPAFTPNAQANNNLFNNNFNNSLPLNSSPSGFTQPVTTLGPKYNFSKTHGLLIPKYNTTAQVNTMPPVNASPFSNQTFVNQPMYQQSLYNTQPPIQSQSVQNSLFTQQGPQGQNAFNAPFTQNQNQVQFNMQYQNQSNSYAPTTQKHQQLADTFGKYWVGNNQMGSQPGNLGTNNQVGVMQGMQNLSINNQPQNTNHVSSNPFL